MKHQYSTHIIWSDEDGVYLAIPDELPGCAADGATPAQALENLKVVIDEWIEVATEEGRPIPVPMSIQAMRKHSDKFRDEVNAQIQSAVQSNVENILKQLANKGPFQRSTMFLNMRMQELEPTGHHRR